MNFNQSLKWINSYQKFGIKLGLDRIKYILDELENPQENYKIIHIAGSNGKGSVCNFISSILIESGFNIGTYTSPHLHDIKERIVVNKKKISRIDFVDIIQEIKPIVEKMKKKGILPTYFEIITAISFQYFKKKKIDYAIIEVGLGGKYDATNIVNPDITIITNISLEHQNILGKKIMEIAYQKAGIIKESIPIFTAANNESLKAIKKIADEKKSPLYIIKNNDWIRLKNTLKFQEFHIKGLLKEYIVKTKLLGKYQGENITISIKTLEYLKNHGINIKDIYIKKGIEKTINPGRMEIINNNPIVLLDGSHNSKGFKQLSEALKNDFKFDKLFFIIGILKDKNIKSMISSIISISNNIITTQSHNKRSINSLELEKIIKKLNKKNKNLKINSKNNIKDAIKYALTLINKNDLICISGSLYTVAEAREFLKKNRKVLTISQ
jgi:dihydrofolate synthase/folylpolyglutamate synthase